MRHLRSDYDAIQPWPVKRAHNAKVDGVTGLGIRPDVVDDPDYDVRPLIPDDEPVFLLRGQDPLAARMVVQYAALTTVKGGDPRMVEALREWAKQMQAWADEHPHGLADVPAGVQLRAGRAG